MQATPTRKAVNETVESPRFALMFCTSRCRVQPIFKAAAGLRRSVPQMWQKYDPTMNSPPQPLQTSASPVEMGIAPAEGTEAGGRQNSWGALGKTSDMNAPTCLPQSQASDQ